MPRLVRFSVCFRDIEIKPLILEVPDQIRSNHLDQILWDMEVVVNHFNEASGLDKVSKYDRFVAQVLDEARPDPNVPAVPFDQDVVKGYIMTLSGDLRDFRFPKLPEIDFDLEPNRASRFFERLLGFLFGSGDAAHMH